MKTDQVIPAHTFHSELNKSFPDDIIQCKREWSAGNGIGQWGKPGPGMNFIEILHGCRIACRSAVSKNRFSINKIQFR